MSDTVLIVDDSLTVRMDLTDAFVAAGFRALPSATLAATILVIEDSATYREELREKLAGGGYGVLTAASGEEGLRIAADRRPSAIVIDGMLPGIDGATVVRRIRLDAALRGIPCLLLTA